MDLEDDRVRAATFSRPKFIPVTVRLLPSAWLKHRDALDEIVARHPVLFPGHEMGKTDYDALVSGTYALGQYVDAWGCVWSNICEGQDAMITGHPAPRREDVWRLRPPEKDDGLPHGFMFLRLTYLRGYEEVMVDFAEEPPELQHLIDLVLRYNVSQVSKLLTQHRPPEILYFGDDLGAQRSLPISPAKWRKYLKPCYATLYGMCREAGFWVYMHSDGHILEIIPDLVECGVNVINPQCRANGLDSLARVCKGRVCVDLDLDRQMFPFCTPAEIEGHVREAVAKLGSPEGGLWLHAEINRDVPLENVEAICAALENYRAHYS